MKILGIELSASDAVLAAIEARDGQTLYCEIAPKKIKLTSDETDAVKAFAQTFNAVVRDNGIEVIAIKKRSKKGEYAGGAVSFKIEGIIQATADVEVILLTPQSIAKVRKSNNLDYPQSLCKYQNAAFETAITASKP